MTDPVQRLSVLEAELLAHLEDDLVPFWLARAHDAEFGGYRTNFDARGRPLPLPEKYLNTQMRQLWWFSALTRRYPARPEFRRAAERGLGFVVDAFWDPVHEGWRWKVARDGAPLDDAKIVYGQSFAVYALAEHALATGSADAFELADRTAELLEERAADRGRGGFLESFGRDWRPLPSDREGRQRKSLDTHMHLMEAFTALVAAGGDARRRERLLGLVELIATRMVDSASGAGGNQFDRDFAPLPAVALPRTWNAERAGDAPRDPVDSTSFGHNLELAWLLRRALEVAGAPLGPYRETLRGLLEHAERYGLDREHGGVYRDGLASGRVLVDEKEFWQNAEALVGFLEGYALFGEPRWLDAFERVWGFARRCFVAPGAGEWRTLLARDGRPIDPALGNPWKVAYHTGRAALEASARLADLQRAATERRA